MGSMADSATGVPEVSTTGVGIEVEEQATEMPVAPKSLKAESEAIQEPPEKKSRLFA